MSDYLCTFSGKYGDILWSLPTAKALSELVNQKVDFYVMPYYANLVPLLAEQPYIDTAGSYVDWVRTHSNYGDQPWQPPEHYEKKYTKFWHLTYKGHPGISAPEMPLINFIAWQQGVNLVNPIPFISADYEVEHALAHYTKIRIIAYAFNEQYAPQKQEFLSVLLTEMKDSGAELVDVNNYSWEDAAWIVSKALLFVGCRSALHVLAIGLGKETITFEPHPARHAQGHLGKVFGCPFAKETPLPFAMPPTECARIAASLIKSRMEKT